jgi:perosamine synthetase
MIDIPLFYTFISQSAIDYIKNVLNSTYLSEGSVTKDFEFKLSSELGIINPTTVNSGTSALHLALVLAGIKPGDEVICPAQTFVASAMVIAQERAVPIFADIKYSTGNIDTESIVSKLSDRTKAIMVVHWGGYPCDLKEINDIARKHKLFVIEDAAHALGATYQDQPIGSISDFTCFSFQAIKHLTTGDGGAICCKDNNTSHLAFVKRWFGIDRENSKPSILGERIYNIDDVGYKYHLNNYCAALGLANLEGFKSRLQNRRKIAQLYRLHLGPVGGIDLFDSSPDRESSYWLFGLHVQKRADFIRALKSRGITASVVHQRIDKNSVFGGLRNDLLNQAKFEDTQVHIPIHDGLTDDEVRYIIDSIKKGW